jgi:hypothetical protein
MSWRPCTDLFSSLFSRLFSKKRVLIQQEPSVPAVYIGSRDFIHDGLKPYYVGLVDQFTALGLADSHFITDLTSGDEDKFWQRIWEAILGCHLAELGHEPSSADEGPDFQIMHHGSAIWIEAICPKPKGIPLEYMTLPDSNEVRVTTMPVEPLTLNWTSALKEKMEKLEGRKNRAGKYLPGYVARGIVGTDQPYVIAVNSGRWGRAETGISQFPFSAEVGFGIGAIAVPVDRETGTFGEAKHTSRFHIENKNKALVGTSAFLGEEYRGVSAVLSTGFLCPQPHSYPYTLVHNPFARAPLPQGVIKVQHEYVSRVDGDFIELTKVG